MGYVLIVGAKSDIARALAKIYAEHGYDLYLAARQAQELDDFARSLHIETGQQIKCVELDILDYSSHEAFYQALPDKPLGTVVAVGYLGKQIEAQTDFSEAQKIIDTNYTGVVSLLNIVAYHYEKEKNGFIVGISSVAGERGRKSNYFYGSAKAGLTAYLSGMANRLYQHNVKVLNVKPGFVATKMTQGMPLPASLTAEPEEVARAIFRAQQKGKSVLYSKSIWRWIMLVVKSIPAWQFNRMDI